MQDLEKRLLDLPPGSKVFLSSIASKYGWTEEETEKNIRVLLTSNSSLGYLNTFEGVFVRSGKENPRSLGDINLSSAISELEKHYSRWDAVQQIEDTLVQAQASEALVRSTDELLKIIGEIGGITIGKDYEDIDVSTLTSDELSLLKQVFELLTTKTHSEINYGTKSTWYNIALVCQKLGWLHEAELCYSLSLQFEPSYSRASNNLGVLLKRQRRYTEAEQVYNTALEHDPTYVGILYNLGVLLALQGRLEEAETSYKKALDYRPSDAGTWYHLGGVLKQNGKNREAKDALKRSLKIAPKKWKYTERAKDLLKQCN